MGRSLSAMKVCVAALAILAIAFAIESDNSVQPLVEDDMVLLETSKGGVEQVKAADQAAKATAKAADKAAGDASAAVSVAKSKQMATEKAKADAKQKKNAK